MTHSTAPLPCEADSFQRDCPHMAAGIGSAIRREIEAAEQRQAVTYDQDAQMCGFQPSLDTGAHYRTSWTVVLRYNGQCFCRCAGPDPCWVITASHPEPVLQLLEAVESSLAPCRIYPFRSESFAYASHTYRTSLPTEEVREEILAFFQRAQAGQDVALPLTFGFVRFAD